MNKAIISNRIFLNVPVEGAKEIMKALTYKIEKRKGGFVSVEIIKNYKILANGVISIPQGRLDLIPDDYEVEDRRVFHEVPYPTAKFPLRPEQQEILDKIEDTCFINALPGWGKTFTALHVAKKLKQKTLVIVHTVALRDQWLEEAELLFDMPIGKIGGSVFDIEDHAIVVGNVQSVVKHIDKISKEFGTVILDEAHHVPATTFNAIIDGMHARYRIGLSGTIQRTDGKQILFKDFFGHTMYTPAQSNTINPKVQIVKTDKTLKPDATWVELMNELLYDNDYQDFVAALALGQMIKGHKVLVVADRVEFLTSLKEKIGEDCVLITGETDLSERKALISEIEKGTKSCIAGSRQIFSEGISINILSCLILAVPTSNPTLLEQLIGRIMRKAEGKKNPLVLDLHFKGVGTRQNTLRKGLYLRKGWDIETIDI